MMHLIPRRATEAKDAEITRAVESVQDALLLTDAQLAKMMRASEVLPQTMDFKNATKLMRSSKLSVRNQEQRRMYADRRASLAVDRVICSQAPEEKACASRWALAWDSLARLPATRRG